MPSVSADNTLISYHADQLKKDYQAYTAGLRGLAAEGLAAISAGMKSFFQVERQVQAFARHSEERILTNFKEGLLRASLRALDASERVGQGITSERSLAVSESLVAGFFNDVSSSVSKQMKRDASKLDDFLRKQLIQGRTFATSEEIGVDLQFKFADKSGREIDSEEYAFREANWALRQHYNSVLMFGSTELGVEKFVVDGGSKAGKELSLEDYDKVSGSIFHHNSKAILQPLTNYAVS